MSRVETTTLRRDALYVCANKTRCGKRLAEPRVCQQWEANDVRNALRTKASFVSRGDEYATFTRALAKLIESRAMLGRVNINTRLFELAPLPVNHRDYFCDGADYGAAAVKRREKFVGRRFARMTS